MTKIVHDVLCNPECLVFAIPIIAILCGAVIAIIKLVIKHRERMELIRQGIHPDYPPDQVEEGVKPPAR
jgi:hypothetical protein